MTVTIKQYYHEAINAKCKCETKRNEATLKSIIWGANIDRRVFFVLHSFQTNGHKNTHEYVTRPYKMKE